MTTPTNSFIDHSVEGLYAAKKSIDSELTRRVKLTLAQLPLTLEEVRYAYNPIGPSSQRIQAIKSYLTRHREYFGWGTIRYIVDVFDTEVARRKRLYDILKLYPVSEEGIRLLHEKSITSTASSTRLWLSSIQEYRDYHDLVLPVVELFEILEMQLDILNGVWKPFTTDLERRT